MADEEKKKTFWETLPGIITAVAALFTALLGGIAAVITAMNSSKDNPPKPDVPAAVQAEAAKEELVRVKAEAELAKARANELEKKLTEAKQKTAVQATGRKQGQIVVDDVTGMKLVYIPKGCFMMGSPLDEKDRDNDESPVHKVCVDSFYMGKYEVMQEQWQKIMKDDSSYFKKDGIYPVENVSWEKAQAFIAKLNEISKKKYRLPTEAEWEYACRAGQASKYCGGDDVDAVAWYNENSNGSTQMVGLKKGNTFGLHDMSGNVWEWCADWYNSTYYNFAQQNNPTGPESGTGRVIRGGGWGSISRHVRAADRFGFATDNSFEFLGFRLVLPVQTDEE